MSERIVAVMGAGIAGLCAALTAHEAGDEVIVFDLDDEPGGTTRLSAGWIWTYRDMTAFRRYAPHGMIELQQAQLDHFDASIAWLEGQGVNLLATDTANPLTRGVRVEPAQLIERLVSRLPPHSLQLQQRVTGVEPPAAPEASLRLTVASRPESPYERLHHYDVDELVLAGGGYAGDVQLVCRVAGAGDPRMIIRRNAGTACGDGVDIATALGARVNPGVTSCYTRLVPSGIASHLQRTSRLSAAWGDAAVLVDAAGRELSAGADDWSDSRRAWMLATSGAPHGWMLLPTASVARASRSTGTIGQGLQLIREAGGRVVQAAPEVLRRWLAAEGAELQVISADTPAFTIAVQVQAGVVHSIGGLRSEIDGRLSTSVDHGARYVDGVRAVGVETGGLAGGGYSSGLAQGLVQARLCRSMKHATR